MIFFEDQALSSNRYIFLINHFGMLREKNSCHGLHFLDDLQLENEYKITQSSQTFIKFKNSKMKLSSTILATFSTTHGFNAGIHQIREIRQVKEF